MPKVTLGRFTEKNERFIDYVKAGLVLNGKNSKDLAERSGTSLKTVYNRYKEPDKMTVAELRAYIRTADVPENEVLDFLYEKR